jgi:heptosyltransferase-2
MKKIAVIQTAFPGDVILSLPLFNALKDISPESQLTAVVRPESVCLLKNNPFVDQIIQFDKYGSDRGLRGIRRLAKKLKGYDKAIIIQRHFRAAFIAFLARIPERVGYDISTARFLYTDAKKYSRDKHEVQRCLDLIDIDNSAMKYRPRIYIDDETNAQAEKLLAENGIKYDFAVAAPGSVWPTKRYAHYCELVDLIYDKLDMQVVLLGGRDDTKLSHAIAESSAHSPLDLTGQTDLLLSAAIISKATLVIANDSAPAHIAAAVDTPVIAIFGPTLPAFGFYPYSEKSAVAEIGTLYCRPCSRHGSLKCPQKHFRCMKDLSPETVLSVAASLLARRAQD